MKQLTLAPVLLFLMTFSGLEILAQEKVETSFHVSGVCGMCKERIEKATDVNGVVFSEWDKDKQELFLVYKPDVIPLDSVHSRIQAVGHDTEKGKAPEENYTAIDGCCHYRDPAVHKAHK
jgi:hypothetical protein